MSPWSKMFPVFPLSFISTSLLVTACLFLGVCDPVAGVTPKPSDPIHYYKAMEEQGLKSFYEPCPFPCYNFTRAFLSEANAIWFKVDKVVHLEPKDSEMAVRVDITRHCRLDAIGKFISDHILISAEEWKALTPKPESGTSYVAAVVPSTFKISTGNYRLVTPLVPSNETYPWTDLCRSCVVNAAENVAVESSGDPVQEVACDCRFHSHSPWEGKDRRCVHVTIDRPSKNGQKAEPHIVLIVIMSVGIFFSLLILLVGLAYWRWRKHRILATHNRNESRSRPLHKAASENTEQAVPVPFLPPIQSHHATRARYYNDDYERRNLNRPLII